MYQNFKISAVDSEIELLTTPLNNSKEKRDLPTVIDESINFLNDNDLKECTLNYYGFTFLIENHFDKFNIDALIVEYKFSQVAKDSLNTVQVDPNTRFHVNQKCTHEFISREFPSQPYGTCISCEQTVFN